MGKKVSFYKGGSDVIILNDTEEIGKGAKILREYFWVFAAHSSFYNLYGRDIAMFYCCRLPNEDSLRKKGFEVERIDIPAKVSDRIFYDMREREFDLHRIPSQKVTCIYVNNEISGIYFSKNRILVATDWTHNVSCIETLKQLLPYLSKIFKRRSKLIPKPLEVTFGADPEFELLANGKVISADGVISGGTSYNDYIGRDGAGSQVEIRPAPSSSLSKFITNFRSILKEFSERYPGYSLGAQGNIYPLGGHIHLSVPPNRDIIALLDSWIGKLVIDLSGNARGSYKRLSAYETKPWGFEYRTPPAAVFLNPRVLYAVLKIIKTILKAYFTVEGVALEPSLEEIARLKIDKEWKILNDFIKNYNDYDKDVLKNWRISIKYTVKVMFQDDWSGDIKKFVHDALMSKLSRLAKKLNKKGVYRVLLFGLRKERGEVCNFDSKIFAKIDFSYRIDNGKAYGLPYSIRVNQLTDELKQKWLVVIDEIVSDLLK